jgi:hypothetical protein
LLLLLMSQEIENRKEINCYYTRPTAVACKSRNREQKGNNLSLHKTFCCYLGVEKKRTKKNKMFYI